MELPQKRSLSQVLSQRPLNVVQACILQVATAIMTMATTMNGYDHYVETAKMLGREVGSFEQFLLSRGASVLVTLLFAWLFYQGKNWARIFYIVFFCINFVIILWSLSILGLQGLGDFSTIDSLISILQVVISCTICGLLLTKNSREWFRDVKAAKNS